ncbi:MAG: GNAT family N-acetyltransferase [Anaerolineaceae bacterium]|nr:GNAT family N-acetyltransferase [Anaerolineaceae bacterium]
MPEIEIRPAVSADIDPLMKIDHTTETSHVWQMERLVEEEQVAINFRQVRLPRQVRINYSRPVEQLRTDWKKKTGFLVALLDKAPVGYVVLSEQEAPASAWISDLVVAPKFRRQGIATGLLLAAQDWSGQRRLRRTVLEMQSKNYPAIKLAFKLGYEFCGYNDHYYANQDIALFFARYLR